MKGHWFTGKDYLIEAMKYHLLKGEQKALFKSPRTKPRQPVGLPKVRSYVVFLWFLTIILKFCSSNVPFRPACPVWMDDLFTFVTLSSSSPHNAQQVNGGCHGL